MVRGRGRGVAKELASRTLHDHGRFDEVDVRPSALSRRAEGAAGTNSDQDADYKVKA